MGGEDMKTARYFVLAAAATVIAGCSKQEPADIRPTDATHEVYLTVKASSADTRTAISPDYAIRWAEGDAIGVFYNTAEIMAEWENIYLPGTVLSNGEIQNLHYPISAGAGTSTAAFSYEDYVAGATRHPASGYYSGNFYWQKGVSQATLYAYYPYYYDAVAGSAYNVEYMPFHLPTTQTGSLDEVAENDLAYASATISRGSDNVVRGEADFRFKHLFSILEITVENSLSDAATVESVTVTAANDKALVGDCTLDLTTGEVTMGKRANSFGQIEGTALSSVLVSPDAGVTLQPKGSTTLYAVVAPCDLAGATVRVTTTTGYQDFTVTGITTEAGKYYRKSVALSDNEFVDTDTHTITFDEEYYNNHIAANIVNGKYYTNQVSQKYSEYWVDPVTKLSTKKPEGENVYPDYAYPFFVSSYNSSSLDGEFGSYSYDLFVYNAGAPTGVNIYGGGHDGSNNFLIGNGYRDTDEYVMYSGDTRPILYFADNKPRVIKSVWVNYTTYFMNVVKNGNGMSSSLDGDCILTVTGYDATGRESAEVEMIFARKDYLLDGWTKLDLSRLGAVAMVRFNLSGGANNGAGFSLPAYYAIDDITVVQ